MENVRENELIRQRRMDLNMTEEEVAEKAHVDLSLYRKIENADADIRSVEFYTVCCILSVLKLNASDFYDRRYRILNGTVVKWDSSHDPLGDGWQMFSTRKSSAARRND